MDSLNTAKWPSLLVDIVTAISSTGNKATGGLKPSSIKTPHDNVKLRAALKKGGVEEPTHWYEYILNQEAYEKKIKHPGGRFGTVKYQKVGKIQKRISVEGKYYFQM